MAVAETRLYGNNELGSDTIDAIPQEIPGTVLRADASGMKSLRAKARELAGVQAAGRKAMGRRIRQRIASRARCWAHDATSSGIRARAAQWVGQVRGRSFVDACRNQQGTPQERGLLRAWCTAPCVGRSLGGGARKLSARQPSSSIRRCAPCVGGLFQLLHSDIAAHAAVAETVEATRALKQPRAAGFVNAVLRRAQREPVRC